MQQIRMSLERDPKAGTGLRLFDVGKPNCSNVLGAKS
jgi:hypothetical protein